MKPDDLLDACILPLSSDAHKGSSGRIGIVGGSERYTGAPYYAGMAALHVGSDLAFVFCADEASLAIKSYSPELMVAPIYSAKEFNKTVDSEDEQQQQQVE
jgi:ATP-dependent NAD(P)H-hydrate dehydratase